MKLKLLRAADLGVDGVVRALERPVASNEGEQFASVMAIIAQVRRGGDRALIDFTRRFDGVRLTSGTLRVTAKEWDTAEGEVDRRTKEALAYGARRVEAYHQRQRREGWWMTDGSGSLLGQQVRPLERVGIYVPGGKASYPSTVLMNAIPARVAGVERIVMVSPPDKKGGLNPAILVAARLAGVAEVYKVGGAQAVAALAYGTETVPRVDKIVGPGNIYVVLAKRAVYGDVGIDMIAGPSEVVVVADETARADWAAADLLAQAEHDEMARPILVTPSEALSRRVKAQLVVQLRSLPRRGIAAKALERNGALVLTRDLDEALACANGLAPEHLGLMVADPLRWLTKVRHAGAVFLGHWGSEAVGDYVAGPNHVLPTGGTARFSSPLGVEDFVKRTSVVYYSREGLAEAWPHIHRLAQVEGLDAHGRAAKARLPWRA